MLSRVLPFTWKNKTLSLGNQGPSLESELKHGAPQDEDPLLCSDPSKMQRKENTPLLAPASPSRQDRLTRLEQLTVQFKQPSYAWQLKLLQTLERSSQAGAELALNWAVSRYLLGDNPELQGLRAVTLGPIVGSQISKLVSALLSIASSSRCSIQSDLYKPRLYQRVKLESQSYVGTLSPDLQVAIRAFDRLIESYVYGNYSQEESFPVLMRRRQGLLLSIPTQIIDVSHQGRGGCDTQRARIDQAVEGMVQQYPDDIHDTLRAFIDQARANCFLPRGRRAQIYLQGPPGTGKTRFVSELATALGLPYQILHLNKDGSLFGKAGWYIRDEQTSDNQIVGEVALGMIKAGCLNPILFFDEAGLLFKDESFLGAFRELLDPDRRELTLEAFSNLKIDFSRAIIVLAGNEPLKDGALLSRLRQVPFGALSSQRKGTVLVAAIDKEMTNNEQLEPKVIAELREQMMGSVTAIIAKDQDYKVPGVRTAIEVAKDLVAFRRSAILNRRPLDDKRVAEFIAGAFEQRLHNVAAEQDAK